MFERDYILRMMEMAADAIGRALAKLRGKKPEEAQADVAAGYAALSLDRELLLVLDGASMRNLIREEDRLIMAARLLLCDCEINLQRDELRMALRLLKAAQRLVGELKSSDEALLGELARMEQLVHEPN